MRYKPNFNNKKEFLNLYEVVADEYDTSRSGTFLGEQTDKLQLGLIKTILKRSGAKKILEAGCGTGRILRPLAREFDCYGTDLASNMLNVLKKKAKTEKLNIKIIKGDIEKLPYRDNVFDGVYTVHVLMHLPDHKKAVEELYRVTKPGGVLILDFPNGDSFWSKLWLFIYSGRKRTRIFSRKQLLNDFKGKDIKITGLFSWPRPLYRIPLVNKLVVLLERFIRLPVSMRTQYWVIMRK